MTPTRLNPTRSYRLTARSFDARAASSMVFRPAALHSSISVVSMALPTPMPLNCFETAMPRLP